MARMTVAEKRRLAIEAAEQAEALEWNNLRAEYNQRLFSLFSLANEFNAKMKFTKETVTFEVGTRHPFFGEYVLPSVLSETRDQYVLDVLLTLEYEFEKFQKARDEEKRRYALKQAALAKLNDEERELLGL